MDGIVLDTWARISGDCPIECEVVGDEAQFRIGGRESGLDLVVTENGLANLIAKSTAALDELRLPGEEISA